jgi:hypothetical protein
MPSFAGDYAAFQAETNKLRQLIASTGGLEPAHRKYIAEIALLRLAILVENTLHSFETKLVCGAPYLDGQFPILLARQRNRPRAVDAMRTFNRARPIKLKWNDGARLRTNIENLVDAADPVFGHFVNHASFLTDVRYIRNHIAHQNAGTRRNYVTITRRLYGATVRGVTVGTILLSPRLSTPPLLETYLITARVMMRDLMRG